MPSPTSKNKSTHPQTFRRTYNRIGSSNSLDSSPSIASNASAAIPSSSSSSVSRTNINTALNHPTGRTNHTTTNNNNSAAYNQYNNNERNGLIPNVDRDIHIDNSDNIDIIQEEEIIDITSDSNTILRDQHGEGNPNQNHDPSNNNMNYFGGGNTRQSLNQPLSFDEGDEEDQNGLELERRRDGVNRNTNRNTNRSNNRNGNGNNRSTNRMRQSEELNSNMEETKEGEENQNQNQGQQENTNNQRLTMTSPWGRMVGSGGSGFRSASRSVFSAISSSSPNSSRPTSPNESSSPSNTPPNSSQSSSSSSCQPSIPEKYKIALTILDSAQKKFELTASVKWTTKQLKVEGQKVHSVQPSQQRLISMGKLLQDDKSLEDQGIGTTVVSYQNGDSSGDGSGGDGGGAARGKAIIHLFPKPNVVISDHSSDTNNHNSTNSTTNSDNNNNTDNNNGGAHVPQIVLDSEEISRRGQILVLSSHEAYESMHRVRLLSFLLLAYSTLQILRDVTIYLAPPDGYLTDDVIPPGDPTDTSSGTYDQEDELPQWQNRDYVEIAIACLGVYVALLGMKATTDHVGYIAKKFLILLGILGISWTLYTFYCHVVFNLALEKALGESDIQHLAMRVSVLETTLPFFLWVMFYVRALQFYALIREAEMEASERALNFLPTVNDGDGVGDGDGDVEDGNGSGSGTDTNGGGSNRRSANNNIRHDLELQVEHGTIT